MMATELIKQESNLWEVLYSQQPESKAPAWLGRLRETALERFKEIGFPSIKDEDWKYTNVAPLTKVNFQSGITVSPTAVTMASVDELGCVEARNSQLVFVNGVLRKDLSSVSDIPPGVIAIDLAEALNAEIHQERVREYLARGVDYNRNGFVALTTAMLSGGAFVLIPRNVEIEKPLSLLFISDASELNAASGPRVLVVAEENSKATLVESYASVGAGIGLNNTVVEIALQDGAKLEHYKVQPESVDSFHLATTNATLGVNASYDSTAINFGAQLSRHDIAVEMAHEGAECWVDGLYVVSTATHDTHSVIDHQQPHCTSTSCTKEFLMASPCGLQRQDLCKTWCAEDRRDADK